MIQVLCGDKRQNGTKDFFTRNRHRVVDIGKQSGFVIIARLHVRGTFSASDQTRAFTLAGFNIGFDSFQLALHGDWTHFGGGIQRRTDLHFLHLCGDGVCDLVHAVFRNDCAA